MSDRGDGLPPSAPAAEDAKLCRQLLQI